METSIQHCTVVPSQCNMRKKRNKGIQITMEEIKLFAEDMLIYVESPNESTKNPMRTKK